MSAWLLCALLFSLTGQTEQHGHPVPIEEVEACLEEPNCVVPDCGTWVLNIKWRDKFAENNESKKVSYDIEVLRTEQMSTVYFETIHVKPDKASYYHWKWTSPIPLQCTSHSVRLRRHNEHHIGEWIPLYTHTGEDLNASTTTVYPKEQVFMVGSNITFCCIVEPDEVPLYHNETFKFLIRISNRTYITKPVPFEKPEYTDIPCNVKRNPSGSTVYIGYPPDDQNLTCITRNLRSVECLWEMGRKTHLAGRTETNYALNGRVCEFGECAIHEVKKQVMNWTLIAKNHLGVKTLTDTADPTHRVWLRAPGKISHVANASNVYFQWNWNEESYTSFPMICQVKLSGSIYNKIFRGVGLSSVDLINLQPFTKYTAQVRCGSHEHFYKWGDWSEIIHFSTKEAIPEAVDVWIHYSEQNTSVLWKPLNQQQSHGEITEYDITIGSSKGKSIKADTQLCYNITSGNEKSDQIQVSAKNSAGLSPPSTIIVPSYPDNEVDINNISSSNGGFEISWEGSPYSTCGYVVEWFPTYKKMQCAVKWKKIPECDSGVCNTWIQSDNFKPGERYTISVYACTNDSPKLLKRSEGYAVETKPGKVLNLKGKNEGRNVELSWNEVPLEQQNGFIRDYKVTTLLSGSIIKEIMTKESKVNLDLDPGSYTFHVSAFTSVGEGGYAEYAMTIAKTTDQIMAATIVGCSAATLVFMIITVLCYMKRKWLKRLLYPDIPEPKLAGQWIKKGIYCTQITEGYMKCEIQEVHNLEHPAISESLHGLDLISSNTKVVPAQHFYQNMSESPADVSYCPVEKLTSIIENPSYNMTIPEPVGVAQISNLTLEMQDDYLPAPNFVKMNFVVEDGYKPQSTSSTDA